MLTKVANSYGATWQLIKVAWLVWRAADYASFRSSLLTAARCQDTPLFLTLALSSSSSTTPGPETPSPSPLSPQQPQLRFCSCTLSPRWLPSAGISFQGKLVSFQLLSRCSRCSSCRPDRRPARLNLHHSAPPPLPVHAARSRRCSCPKSGGLHGPFWKLLVWADWPLPELQLAAIFSPPSVVQERKEKKMKNNNNFVDHTADILHNYNSESHQRLHSVAISRIKFKKCATKNKKQYIYT